MESLGRSLLVMAAFVALAASPAPRLSVSVRPKPKALEAGAAWQPVIRIRRGGRQLVRVRPAVVISKAGARRSLLLARWGAASTARVVFPSAGRWAYSVRLGKRTFRLGSAAVRARAVRLVAASDVVVDADGSLVVADVIGNQVVRLPARG